MAHDTTTFEGTIDPEKVKRKLSEKEQIELEIDEARLAEEEARVREERQRQAEDLAYKIEKDWYAPAGRRKVKEEEWMEQSRLFYGSLAGPAGWSTNPDEPYRNTEVAKNRPNFNIVRDKCEIAISQCDSMQFGAGDKNWDLFPDPTSEKEDKVQRAEGMSQQIGRASCRERV